MARPLQYTPPAPTIEPGAREELDRLLESLHRHGVLRLANDLVSANADLMEILVRGLSQPGSLNAIQNLCAVLMSLSQIEPANMYKLTSAIRDAVQRLSHFDSTEQHDAAPGVTGAYRLLHDEALWSAAAPLVEALKAFSDGLGRDVDKPISSFSGKQTQG
ncbi:hypothetical protein RM530_12585 [Algiphilus sp. W345]|uniref:DUF1641 domain-containing protein n=1 Tax=Banduia mediterranea TaxID=3075609 RepID=A0ABU2WLL0_9GAMM|nr:hypothetical protein [Algiphilus sp. W345]MDT0498196.1 hypothetical protein [Algiphilus sp. W345]